MFGLIVPWYARWIVLGLLMVAAASFGAFRMHDHDRKAYDKLQGEFEVFKDNVRALGIQAKKDAKAKELLDQKRKEASDHENALAVADLADTVAKLRARNSGRGIVPPAAPGASRPDLACFDRTELGAAYGILVERLRSGADESSKDTIDLNTAKKWAQKVE